LSTTYRVYIQPRTSLNAYGSEIDVTDSVKLSGLQTITRSIDSSDYNFSVYTYNDIDIAADNSFGKFNDVTDSRSIFPYLRDLSKVRVVFSKDGTDYITYRGIINEEATRADIRSDEIIFKVLSRDSVIRKAKVESGTVGNGVSYQLAINAVLGSDGINRVLNVSLSNINPAYNGIVDDGSKFNNVDVRSALNNLLLVSNSILVLDSSDNVIVKSRNQSAIPPLLLFGKGNSNFRENIVDIANFNTGLHRLFNSVKINNTVANNQTSIDQYGAKQKAISLEFLTNPVTELAVGNALVSEWKFPKIEVEVTVDTSLVQGYDLLDRVSLDYPLVRRPTGRFIPIYGITKFGDAAEPFPYITGSIVIAPTTAFKIIEIKENTRNFLSVLKLREVGTGLDDGGF